jgi:hypothetical protein
VKVFVIPLQDNRVSPLVDFHYRMTEHFVGKRPLPPFLRVSKGFLRVSAPPR